MRKQMMMGLLIAGVSGWGRAAAPAEGVNRFAWELYQKLPAEGNAVLSPYSVASALAMTAQGARGTTEREMWSTLHLASDNAKDFAALDRALASAQGVDVTVANRLWGAQRFPFESAFLSDSEKLFGAGLEPLDFAKDGEGARRRINGWVEEKTHRKILNLVPRGMLTPRTALVLTNAIYFKGQWAEKFDPARSGEAVFRNEAGGESMVPFMRRTGEYPYAETENFQIVELPYRGGELSMVVYLPKSGKRLADAGADLLTVAHQLEVKEVMLSLPRWTMATDFRLAEPLRALGMRSAFSERAADFSGISRREGLFISEVLHKAFVEVGEEGTEAAAATAVVMLKRGVAPPPVEFRAGHPFLFTIRHRPTGTILFLGRVTSPE